MRLVDLLRSRSKAVEHTDAGGTGAAYLSEKDVSALFTGKGKDSGRRETNGTGCGDIARDTNNTGASASRQSSPANNAVSDARHGLKQDEWPDDPLDAYADTTVFLEADTAHDEVFAALSDIYGEGERGEPISIDRLIEPARSLIDICGRTDTILRKAVRMKEGPISFPQHSLETAITAIKAGIVRGYNEDRLFQLALCALLGDIGMTRVNPDILGKTGKLSSDEFSMIREHVSFSLDIVKEVEDRFPFLPTVTVQIHERENGSGYPAGLKGDAIHEYARIIGLCDVYTALTEPKVNREKYSGFVALQQIISRRGEDFSRDAIKSLIEAIGIFPLESLVKLNNGLIGRIVGISSVHPTRPQLSVLVNADGARLPEPYLLDLEHEPLLYIDDPDIEEGAVLNA